MHFAERIAKKLERYGEQFELNSQTYRGVFKLLDSGTMRTYLDDGDMMSVVHPALLLVTLPDVTINVNDTITRDGRVYVVLKTALHRIGDTPVAQTAILN
jgi:hypothetical protein